MKASHNKLSLKLYDSQSKHLSRIFDLLRHSLKELNGAGYRRFMENERLHEAAVVDKQLEEIKKLSDSENEFGDFITYKKRKHRKNMSEDLPVTPTLKWAEYKGYALLGLNSNELIFRVALFEAFLKEIHRQTLLANEKLLSLCKPNRPIVLKDVFRGGFERFKLAEIDRQVRETDRLRTKEKAKFFRQRLKLPWHNNLHMEGDLVRRIDQLIKLRHELVHSDHHASVTGNDIGDTRELFKKVPGYCIHAAVKIYPMHFAMV